MNPAAAPCTVHRSRTRARYPKPARLTRLTALSSLRRARTLPPDLESTSTSRSTQSSRCQAASAGARRPCIVPSAPPEPCVVNPKFEAMHSARIPAADPEPHFVVAASSRTQRRVCCYSGLMEQLRWVCLAFSPSKMHLYFASSPYTTPLYNFIILQVIPCCRK